MEWGESYFRNHSPILSNNTSQLSGSESSRAAEDITKFINQEAGDMMFELLMKDFATGRLQVRKFKHFEQN